MNVGPKNVLVQHRVVHKNTMLLHEDTYVSTSVLGAQGYVVAMLCVRRRMQSVRGTGGGEKRRRRGASVVGVDDRPTTLGGPLRSSRSPTVAEGTAERCLTGWYY